jgi:hypothetical protein
LFLRSSFATDILNACLFLLLELNNNNNNNNKQYLFPKGVPFYSMLKNSAEYERDIPLQNLPPFLAKFLLIRYYASLLAFSRELWCMNQECFEHRWGTHNSSENGRSA